MLIFCSLAVACSGEMATLSVKPGQRFTVPDWHTNADLISADAESQRSASHRVRQETRALRNETNNQVGLQQLIHSRVCQNSRLRSVGGCLDPIVQTRGE